MLTTTGIRHAAVGETADGGREQMWEQEEGCGDPQGCSSSSDPVCVCVCVCARACVCGNRRRPRLTGRKGGTDFREMLGGNGTNHQNLRVHGSFNMLSHN